MAKKTFGQLTLSVILLLILAPQSGSAQSAPAGMSAGPDIITGEIGPYYGLNQIGSAGTQVGLSAWTTICNAGNVPVDVFALPDTNHAIIPQNLYRMSGGAGNNGRFEQIGHSWVKHMFAAAKMNDCGFGCTTTGTETQLGAGCSDAYSDGQNAYQEGLSSRAWVNPFTGVFQTSAIVNDHGGHLHTETSHRLLVERNDLNTAMNPGATYYAEVQYLSPHEYAWCQTHPGQCNMYNNASYRRFNVSGTTNFTLWTARRQQIANEIRGNRKPETGNRKAAVTQHRRRGARPGFQTGKRRLHRCAGRERGDCYRRIETSYFLHGAPRSAVSLRRNSRDRSFEFRSWPAKQRDEGCDCGS